MEKSSPAHHNRKQTGHEPAYAGPAARRLARELGIAIAEVTGTGRQGRITCDDVKHHAQNRRHSTQSSVPGLSLPQFDDSCIRREPLSGIARTTARNMTNAWQRIPHAWIQSKADITRLEQWRQQWNRDRNEKLTLISFFIMALAKNLRAFPLFNSCYDEDHEEQIYKAECNIGLAVDTPRGLLVPVIRKADTLPLAEISEQISSLAAVGRKNRLLPGQLTGGGMTISSLGGMDIDSLYPIINWPEVAILGVGAAKKEPFWDGETFVPRTAVNLVLGFDHRIINGADAARFLGELKQLLQSPSLLSLNL